MALLFLDSFGTYSAIGELTRKWTSVSGTLAFATGQFAANGLNVKAGFASTALAFKQLTANTMKRIGFWFTFSSQSISSSGNAVHVRGTADSNDNNNSVWMKLHTNGGISFFDGAASAVLIGSMPAGTLLQNSNYWFELEIKTTGMKFYIDGLLVFSYTGTITNSRDLGFSKTGSNVDIDNAISHLVVWDDTGTTFTAFPLGPQRTQAIRPTAAGAVADWTPASGANWQAVDSAGWAGGVGVSTLVNAKDDKHNCTDLAWNSYKINSVVLSLRAVDLNTGGSGVAPLLQDASGTAVGSFVALPMTNPTIVTQNFDKDSVGGDWTKTKIDAMQIGYRSQI